MSCTIKIHMSYTICCHILSFNTTILPLLAIFPMYADIIPNINNYFLKPMKRATYVCVK